ncbi:MAG: DNA primase [Chloroflexi bacterium]|nr:DNA primase [Chloroflexota bacterium]
MSTIEEVKSRLDIVETVGSYVPNLKRSGRTWKANCPFHNERTPSFIVDPTRNSWHCFGACSTGGDVIEFVRRFEGLEFREALRRCAERAGVELRPPTRAEREQREQHEQLLSANEAAAVFFQAALDSPEGAAALAYAEGRGLDAGARRDWQIGYAPDSWQALTDHLGARGFGPDVLIAAGLAIEGNRGPYDRFRGRLIFPTRDERGRLTGFGGRALLDDQEPKYLNTPQTPLFDKSGTLYGVDRAGPEARRAEQLIVVEGYMDVIGCWQAGLRNVSASMGTAISERQMRLVKRFTPNVVLALDADNAGSEATLRAVGVAAGAADHDTVATIDWRGLVSYQDVLRADIRIAALPEGEDPDSLARKNPDDLRTLIAEARPVADHLFDAIEERTNLEDPRARSQAVEALAPTVAAMAAAVVRAHWLQRLARLGRISEAAAQALVARGRGPVRPAPVPSSRELAAAARQQQPPPGTPPASDVNPGETQLLRLLLRYPSCRDAGAALDADTFEDGAYRRLFEAWCADEDLVARLEQLDEELRELYASLSAGALPEAYGQMTEAQLREEVEGTAWQLRTRRRQARVRAETGAVAEQIAEARREGAGVLEFALSAAERGALPADAASEEAELATSFVELSRQQRELARAFAAAGEYGEHIEQPETYGDTNGGLEAPDGAE